MGGAEGRLGAPPLPSASVNVCCKARASAPSPSASSAAAAKPLLPRGVGKAGAGASRRAVRSRSGKCCPGTALGACTVSVPPASPGS